MKLEKWNSRDEILRKNMEEGERLANLYTRKIKKDFAFPPSSPDINKFDYLNLIAELDNTKICKEIFANLGGYDSMYHNISDTGKKMYLRNINSIYLDHNFKTSKEVSTCVENIYDQMHIFNIQNKNAGRQKTRFRTNDKLIVEEYDPNKN